MVRAWKFVWPSVCRTIRGWRFCFANKAIRSAAVCVKACRSISPKDSMPGLSHAMRIFRACGNCASRFPAPNLSILSIGSGNRSATNTSLRRGTSIITKPFTRPNRAQPRCRQPDARLRGSCCSISSAAASIQPISFCMLDFRLTWMTSSTRSILHRKKNIWSARPQRRK